MDGTLYRFWIFRYFPSPIRQEFVNIGILLLSEEKATVRITSDWARVLAADRNADIDLLSALQVDLQGMLDASERDVAQEIDHLLNDLANSLRIENPDVLSGVDLSNGKAGLSNNIPLEAENLMKIYVEPLQAVEATVFGHP